MLKQYKLRNYRFQLIAYMVVLTIIGIFVVGSADVDSQDKQIIGFVGGMILMVIISLMDYKFVLKFYWLMYIGINGLLLLVKFVGHNAGGSQRWINIAGIRFQPSELAKIVIVLFFAAFFMKFEEKINTIYVLMLSFALVGVSLILIKTQPDLSTTIICALIFITLLFIAGLSYKIVMMVLGITVPSLIIGIAVISKYGSSLLDDYQYMRIMAWLDPTNPLYAEKALQQRNSIMAIGSGQLFGKGLNNSLATSLKNADYIIEPQTDFIFAVVGEELGFIGTAVVIGLLLLIVLECIMVARRANDMAGRLIGCGMAALVGFQAFVNICVATGLFPNTGVPLPFVSYGLTSLMSLYIGMGFVLNVGLQPKKYH